MPQTFEAKALKLCLLETECPNIQQEKAIWPTKRTPHTCEKCGGTRRVPLLDPKLVRVECACETNINLAVRRLYKEGHFGDAICAECLKSYSSSYDGRHSDSCTNCQGCRWTPRTDPQVYIQAAWNVGPTVFSPDRQSVAKLAMMQALSRGQDFVLAAFDVVWESLMGKEKP